MISSLNKPLAWMWNKARVN